MRKGLLFLLAAELIELGQKGLEVLEFAVDRGKADIRHLVHALKPCEHHLTDLLGRHVLLQRVLKLGLNIRNDLLGIDRALLAGLENTLQKLSAVKGLLTSVLLENKDLKRFNDLISRKAFFAGKALATAANTAVGRGSGIDHLTVKITTSGTLHIYKHAKMAAPFKNDVPIITENLSFVKTFSLNIYER